MRILITGGGVSFVFAMTCLGAASVFFFRKRQPGAFQQIFLGFAAGVMLAASVWSLLIPAINQTSGMPGWIPAATGVVFGSVFLLGMDAMLLRLRRFSGEGMISKRTALLVFAVTLHNIPEGMAVGLSFGLALRQNNPALQAAAMALALGIGIQNIPEGTAVSLPLQQDGVPPVKAFLLACLSGAVEPIFAALAILLAFWVAPVMPWLLSFAAGAMIYVALEELIPQAHCGQKPRMGIVGAVAGFVLMMSLDVALG